MLMECVYMLRMENTETVLVVPSETIPNAYLVITLLINVLKGYLMEPAVRSEQILNVRPPRPTRNAMPTECVC